MDQFLYEYLNSGKAWLLVGSGPSIEMGYPSWEQLSSISMDTAKSEQPVSISPRILEAYQKHDYPVVFSEIKKILGGQRLLQILRDNLKPTTQSKIYKLITQWPVQVYLTTNYDNELQNNLTNLGLAYTTYSNSEDHFSLMLPDLTASIIKLHGDLISENNTILTEEDYEDITKSKKWEYWRIKMTSVFQMNRVIVIGYSLSDKNVKHVLEAAKKGSGVSQPVVWIAPNITQTDRKLLLNQYRIRVISYDDRDGKHKNLLRLIESINEFIPPRTIVKVREQIGRTWQPTTPHIAAAGFFVFNELSKRKDYEQKRVDIVVSAIQASLPELNTMGKFNLQQSLEIAGWPNGLQIDSTFSQSISERSIKKGILIRKDDGFAINQDALTISLEKRHIFEQMRLRFKNSLILRLRRDFPELVEKQINVLSNDIEFSLVQYFRDGGLSLASILFSKGAQRTMPGSILTFITAASTRYDDFTLRLAFFKTSIDCFVHSEVVEIDYLGRLSQGFFAFHGLGVFGDVAAERLKMAKETVWLIDSDSQIRTLALGASANTAFRECILRLRNIGLRFFTTSSLMSETYVHLWFANNVIKENGQNSPFVIASANGETPYRKPNLFMEGFIRWQSAGNPCIWANYLYEIFGVRNIEEIDMKKAFGSIGIEVLELSEWPGFSDIQYAEVEEYAKKITNIWEQSQESIIDLDSDLPYDPYKKAKPEAEAYNIVLRERSGDFHIISAQGMNHNAWFISHTSILNILQQNVTVTWQPLSFLSFASTLCELTDADLAKQAFERIILGLAQSGLNLLDDETIARVFGGVIEQAKLDIGELRQEYQETLQQKYGESIESVLARVPIPYYLGAVTQITSEIAQKEAELRHAAENEARVAYAKLKAIEKETRELEKYRTKLLRRKSRKKKK